MTADEADELAADLERAEVRVDGIEPRPHFEGEWQLYCWCPDPPHFYTITDAQRFREAVRAGLILGRPAPLQNARCRAQP